MDRTFRDLNAIGLLCLSGVLAYALWSQFIDEELPCPLCLLQRLGFVGVMAGLLLNLVFGPRPAHYGLASLSAVFGMAAALRQTALHVIPGSGTYGPPLFGLHFYVWAFILFGVILVGLIVMFSCNAQYSEEEHYLSFSRQNALGKCTLIACVGVVVLNLLSTFAQCGPFVCPDDPAGYWLLSSGGE